MADSRNTSVFIGLLEDPVQNLGVAMPSAYIVSDYPIGDEHKNIGKVMCKVRLGYAVLKTI